MRWIKTLSPSSSCKLVSVTPDAEKTLIYCARVSNPAGQSNENYVGLIRYLIKHEHWSPFEMANMVIEINTTRAISAQIIRHRSFSMQEFSQRYSDVGSLGSPTIPDLRRQDYKNRQNSFDDVPQEQVGSTGDAFRSCLKSLNTCTRKWLAMALLKNAQEGSCL